MSVVGTADRPQEMGLERLRKGALLCVSLDPPSHMTAVADEQAGRNRVYLVAADDPTPLALQRRLADPGRFEILAYLASSPVTHLEHDETILRAPLLEAFQPGPVLSASPAPCRPEVQGNGLSCSREGSGPEPGRLPRSREVSREARRDRAGGRAVPACPG